MKHVHRMIIKTCALVFLITLVFFIEGISLIPGLLYIFRLFEENDCL